MSESRDIKLVSLDEKATRFFTLVQQSLVNPGEDLSSFSLFGSESSEDSESSETSESSESSESSETSEISEQSELLNSMLAVLPAYDEWGPLSETAATVTGNLQKTIGR